MTEDLKPCPICGKRPVIENHISIFGVSKVCDIRCPSKDHIVRINHCQSEIEAVAAWNQRAEPDELPEWAKKIILENRVICRDDFDDPLEGYDSGWNAALDLVLSLRREDGQ